MEEAETKVFVIESDDEDDSDVEEQTPYNNNDGLLVTAADSSCEQDEYQTIRSNVSGYPNIWASRLERTLLPDDRFSVRNVDFFEGPIVVKWLKFLAFTVLGIFGMYHFVRWVVGR